LKLLSPLFDILIQIVRAVIRHLNDWFKAKTKPNNERLAVGTAFDLTRGKSELMAENALLRQQLIVLNRQIKRPQLTQHDRLRLVFLASLVSRWKEALIIVKPDTLLKWHRQGFCLFWKQKSRSRTRKPRIDPEALALIQAMAVENRLWGAKRIRDELSKLGHKVSKRTVAKYMRQARKDLPPWQAKQTWSTFIKNHAHEMGACDFVQTYDLFFGTIFIFFIVDLSSRCVVYFNVTRSPTDVCAARQLRQSTQHDEHPRFLIRDNDSKYGTAFNWVAASTLIDVLRTPIRAPKANAIYERFIGSVRRGCLDHILIISEHQLYWLVKEYVEYFNHSRPHQGIGSQIPQPRVADNRGAQEWQILTVPVLGGLHHDYRRAA
jgi:transposase InsO family protein